VRRHARTIFDIAFGIWGVTLVVLALTRWDHYEGTTKALFISLAFAGSVSAAMAIRDIAGRHR
jgi:hypothetical protein